MGYRDYIEQVKYVKFGNTEQGNLSVESATRSRIGNIPSHGTRKQARSRVIGECSAKTSIAAKA